MCGIAGLFEFDPNAQVVPGLLKQMCSVIRHRGPDDEGYLFQGPVGLGARRLSIIDLQTGHQPIANEDESAWVAFNGEIYNFAELRRSLEQRGHRFRTRTDTEVIVHLYEDFGPDCVRHLRGMFAFVVWDARAHQLFLARDRLGIKPLYYACQPHRFLFGSELKCLLQVPGFAPRVDPTALNHYISLRYVPEPWTVLSGTRKLRPGHWLLVRPGNIQEQEYWELPWPEADEDSQSLSEEEHCERIRALVQEAVRLQLVSDVPLGALLSGGMDSSTVVAMMAKLMDRPVKTFSIGFPEPDFSELEHARSVAHYLGTDHHEMIVRPEAVGLIDRLMDHFDEPFGDAASIPTFLLSQLARESVTVAMAGDGGDELFGGYTHYVEARRQQVFDLIPRWARRRLLVPLSQWLPPGMHGKNYLRHIIAAENGLARFLNSIALPTHIQEQLVVPELRTQMDGLGTHVFLGQSVRNGSRHSLLEQALYLDTKVGLPGDMLTKVDRMSMAHSLEVRVPLLDHVLVEYVARLPLHFKLRRLTTKYIFKRAFRAWLPTEIARRRKMGFGVPLRHWFRNELRDYLQDVLLERRTANRGYFQMGFLRSLVREHLNGRRDHSHLLWSLLVLEMWHRNAGL